MVTIALLTSTAGFVEYFTHRQLDRVYMSTKSSTRLQPGVALLYSGNLVKWWQSKCSKCNTAAFIFSTWQLRLLIVTQRMNKSAQLTANMEAYGQLTTPLGGFATAKSHWRRNLFGSHGQSRTTFSGGTYDSVCIMPYHFSGPYEAFTHRFDASGLAAIAYEVILKHTTAVSRRQIHSRLAVTNCLSSAFCSLRSLHRLYFGAFLIRWPWNAGLGASKMIPFDRPSMTYY